MPKVTCPNMDSVPRLPTKEELLADKQAEFIADTVDAAIDLLCKKLKVLPIEATNRVAIGLAVRVQSETQQVDAKKLPEPLRSLVHAIS